MKAYILRAKPHGKNKENEFLNGRLSVGWPCGEDFKGKSPEQLSPIITKHYPKITATSLSMVNLFVNMPVDAIVVVPSLQDRSLIHIFRTVTTYKYDGSADCDVKGNPHFVNAELLKTVVRSNLPKAVFNSLSGARKTLSSISQHYEILDEFIKTDFKVDPKLENNYAKAMNILSDLLNSENENIRLNAAIAIIGSSADRK